MLKTINKIFSLFNDQNISYCHWKSSNHLDETMNGITDIDILVDSDMAEDAEILMRQAGFERFHTVPLRSYPGIHDFICLDESGTWVHLHLHYKLILGDRWAKAYHLPFEKEILSRVQYSEKYQSYVIDPLDEMMLLIIRMSLKFYFPFNKKSVCEELKFIKRRYETSSKNQYDGHFKKNFKSIDKFASIIFSENDEISFRKLNRYAWFLSREMNKYRRFGKLRHIYLSWKRKIYRYAIEFNRRILSDFRFGRRTITTGGKIIAIVGMDGSGKSTTVKKMVELYAIQMNTTSVFLGNGKSGASWYRKIFFFLLGTKATFSKHKKINRSNKESKAKKTPFYYALWIYLCLLDKRKNLKKAIKNSSNGSLVISDRWPQTDVSGTFDGPRLANTISRNPFVNRIVQKEKKFYTFASQFKPDLLIRLRVSPENSLKRKPNELSLENATKHSSLIGEIEWPAQNIVDIDADQSQEKVFEDVRTAIWDCIKS